MNELFWIGFAAGSGWGVCFGLVAGAIIVGALFASAQKGAR